MALSKLTSTTVATANVDSHGFSMLRDSLHYFKAALCQFRVCHDLCATSKLLDQESVAKLEQCAAEFRRLSTTVATLAEKISSVWCRTCLLFYRNIDKLKGNPAKILCTISTQSRELADGFKGVADMSEKLAAMFKTVKAREQLAQSEIAKQFNGAVRQLKELQEKIQKSVMTEAQEFTEPTDVEKWEEIVDGMDVKSLPMSGKPLPKEEAVTQQVLETFENLQQKASEEKKKAEENYERAQTQSRSVAANAKNLKSWARAVHHFPPLRILLPNIDAQAASLDSELEDAQAHERIAKKKFQEAKKEFDVRTDQAEKAKVTRFYIQTEAHRMVF